MYRIQIRGLKNLNKAFEGTEKQLRRRLLRGLVKGANVIKRASMLKTPVEFGNLVGSTYMVWTGGKASQPPQFNDESGVKDKLEEYFNNVLSAAKSDMLKKKNPSVEFGFGAFYGIYVHEDLLANHKVGEAKFLEKAINENMARIKSEVTDEAKKS